MKNGRMALSVTMLSMWTVLLATPTEVSAGMLLNENASPCEIKTVMTKKEQPGCPEVFAAIQDNVNAVLEPGSGLKFNQPRRVTKNITNYPQSMADKRDVLFNGIRGEPIEVTISFELNSARLSKYAKRFLDAAAPNIQEDLKADSFSIIGSTDISGPLDYNMRLSRSRAISVLTYLVEHHDVVPERLQFEGVGPNMPIDPNHPEHEANRRVIIYRHAGTMAGR